MPGLRRKNLLASRRRVEDEGEEEEGPDAPELDDDSMSEGSAVSDLDDPADGSEASDTIPQSISSPAMQENGSNGQIAVVNGAAKKPNKTPNVRSKLEPLLTLANGMSDTDMMLNGLKISDQKNVMEEIEYENLREQPANDPVSLIAVKSTAQMDQPQETPLEKRRREHEEYKSKRDADPAFVPNRGAFFMHDHRHPGPAANGFRPFGRGRGRGRAGNVGIFMPMHNFAQAGDASDAPWTHDMHEAVLQPDPPDTRKVQNQCSTSNSNMKTLAQASRGPPLNRSLSTTKHVGNVQIRVFLHNMKEPIKFPATAVHQYTRLPDHRPPLRRDKPVRISLPDHPPKYIYPAVERSFIFIPRAMRPNQQGFGSRNRGRAGLGSIGGYSRRTSIYGGSVFGNGSAYTPSIAMSRRSSLAYEVSRDSVISPNGSTMSRPPMPIDTSRPVVRLPPPSQLVQPGIQGGPLFNDNQPAISGESASIEDLPRPQTYPLPQKPTFRENRTNAIPMHQPRPQKAVSVADIESPANLTFNPPQQHQQPFHQQVPQMNGSDLSLDTHLHPHSRNPSYPSQASTGTPLSQIPERAIHAQPFQPHPYQPQQGYYPQQYQFMPAQPGYYYPQPYAAPMAPSAPAFVSAAPQQQSNYAAPQPVDTGASQQNGQPNLVAQEVNGMVYYYDASQIPAVAAFPAYPPPQAYPMQQVNMGGMMTPSPDGFYYPQPPQSVVYYSQ